MFNRKIICILLLVILTTQKTTVLNLPKTFAPTDEAEYAAYLQAMLGKYIESIKTSDNIKQLIANERPSILTAPEKIVLLLATLSEGDRSSDDQAAIKIGGGVIKRLIQQYQTIFEVKLMLNVNREALEQTIKEQQSEGYLVNAIVGQEKEILQIQQGLTNQIQVSPSRRLQAATTDSTYLIKFFFSLIFILVIVACVSFISANQGKKDTLLYAKFIADVGAR